MEKFSWIKNLNMSGTFDLNIGGFKISPNYFQAGVIILLLFLLLLTLARVRRIFIDWSFSKTSLTMLFWGFILALIIEGFFIIGGRTLLTEILEWKNPPKPISFLIQKGKERLMEVVKDESQIDSIEAVNVNHFYLLNLYNNLPEDEAIKVRESICPSY